MVRVVAISIADKSQDRKRRTAHHRDDEKQQQIPGWSAERTPRDEPYIANKNLSLGQWLRRAEANSGPKIAPGTGRKSS
jgi:hypothetical protein